METAIFTDLDYFIFIGSLFLVMLIGFLLGGSDSENKEEYFLGGHSIPWWGVAGSIFGTNVSANHLVGMLGVGYSIGFAQSHYELGAIFALLLLAYGFLPVYLRMNIYTLSEYLGKRYSDYAQLFYSITMIALIMIQMVSGFYIGSRSMMILFKGTILELSFANGVWFLVVLTAAYTIFGGIKAVIYTDVIQSFLLLLAGLITAYFTFSQVEIGGFFNLLKLDASQEIAKQKFHLYLPSNHSDLPWTGAFTGLMMMHAFYWGTNQYLVQRALAAKNIKHARIGILVGGYLKLLIPFFSISTGIAAYYLFNSRFSGKEISPDSAFSVLVGSVVPVGYGLVGLISAGLLGAIFSTIDSMMNSASTLFTLDIYKKFYNPNADDKKIIKVGQLSIVGIVILSAFLAIFSYTPDTKGNFFLKISALSSYFIPGLLVSFILGIFSKRANSKGAILSIILAPIFGFLIEFLYNDFLSEFEFIKNYLGIKLNFLHRFFFSVLFSYLVHLICIWKNEIEEDKIQYTLVSRYQEDKRDLYQVRNRVIYFLIIQFFSIYLYKSDFVNLFVLGLTNSILVLFFFLHYILKYKKEEEPFYKSDRLMAGILTSITVFLLYYFA